MAIAQKLSIIQKKGQVTIPAEIRNKLGLMEGDVVDFTETVDGVLISPQAVIAAHAPNRIGDALQVAGVDIDELIAQQRQLRLWRYVGQFQSDGRQRQGLHQCDVGQLLEGRTLHVQVDVDAVP